MSYLRNLRRFRLRNFSYGLLSSVRAFQTHFVQSSYFMMPDLILDLPQVLLSDLLVNWLGVGCVGRFDAALCVRSKREELTALLDNLEEVKDLITTPQRSNEIHVSLIKWAVARQIKISAAVFQHDTYWTEQSDVMREFFHQNGQRLKSIKIENCDCAMSNTMKLVTTKSPNLETLAVIRCTLTMEIPKMLMRKDIHIRELHLESKRKSERKIAKSYFEKVQCLTVERLHLAGYIEEGCLVAVAKAFPNLLDVYFRIRFDSPKSYFPKYRHTIWPTGETCWMDFIAACNPKLRAIALGSCASVTEAIWGTMLSRWTQLDRIAIMDCRLLNENALTAISSAGLSALQSLTISRFHSNCAALLSVFHGCPNLSILHIYSSNVENTVLQSILRVAPSLRELDLRETWRVNQMFKLVADYGQNLEVFAHGYNAGNSGNMVTPYAADIATLVRKCPKLRVLKIAHDHTAAKEAGRPGLRVELPSCESTWYEYA